MKKLEYPIHIRHKFDKTVVIDFAKDLGIDIKGDTDTLVYSSYVDINEEKDKVERENKLSLYHQFVIDTIKYGDNREVLTFQIDIGETSPLTAFPRLLNHLNVDRRNFFVSKVMFPEHLNDDYTLLYRKANINPDDDTINSVELIYGRHVKYTRPIKNTKRKSIEDRYEYVWVEIDVVKSHLRMTISQNEKNQVEGKENGTRTEIVNKFLPKLRNDFIFSIKNEADESYVLFKMYKELTEYIEKEYNDKITLDIKKEISEFTEKVKRELQINNREDINLSHRIEKLFERNLIKKDFENFIKKRVREGRVLNVGFTDSVGGSVRANSGGRSRSVEGEIIFDLQDSHVYFDIKETMYTQKSLQSITISWMNEEVLKEDSRYSEILVKYTAFSNHFSTHFLRRNTRKEIYDYVLPKFEHFKRR